MFVGDVGAASGAAGREIEGSMALVILGGFDYFDPTEPARPADAGVAMRQILNRQTE